MTNRGIDLCDKLSISYKGMAFVLRGVSHLENQTEFSRNKPFFFLSEVKANYSSRRRL